MKPLIIANWKCNPTNIKQAKGLFNSVNKGVRSIRRAEVVVCPPFIYLSSATLRGVPRLSAGSSKFQVLGFKFGAQNCFWEQEGAYTGEISPEMLKDSGCQYIIVGHSERRKYFAETDKIINKKLKAVLEIKLNPILCIGETQEERDREETETVFKKQIKACLEGVSSYKLQVSRFCIAYEPVWAIGTGNPCDIEEAQKMGLLIRKIISKLYNSSLSKKIPILYGGSADSRNARGYVKEAGFNGLLVGGASLNAKEFIKLVKEVI